jgi:hypothetical protein
VINSLPSQKPRKIEPKCPFEGDELRVADERQSSYVIQYGSFKNKP